MLCFYCYAINVRQNIEGQSRILRIDNPETQQHSEQNAERRQTKQKAKNMSIIKHQQKNWL